MHQPLQPGELGKRNGRYPVHAAIIHPLQPSLNGETEMPEIETVHQFFPKSPENKGFAGFFSKFFLPKNFFPTRGYILNSRTRHYLYKFNLFIISYILNYLLSL